MEFISKITENIRVPHFFRDILFLGGGMLILFFFIFFVPEFFQSRNINVRYGDVFLNNLNFFAYSLIFTLAYFLGRLSDIVADFFYDLFKFFCNILFFCKEKDKTYYEQFKRQVDNFINGGNKVNPLKKLTKENPNFIQATNYLNKNRLIADNLERGVFTDIIYSHFFVFVIALSFIFSKFYLILAIFVFFKKYQIDQQQNSLYGEIRRVVRFENEGGQDEANRELKKIEATRNLRGMLGE